MLTKFLRDLPNIFIVFLAFVFLLLAWLYTKEDGIFNLANTALGAVIGLAMKSQNNEDSINVDNIEKIDVIKNKKVGDDNGNSS